MGGDARDFSPAHPSPALLSNVSAKFCICRLPLSPFPSFLPSKAMGEHALVVCMHILSYSIGTFAVCLSHLRINLKDDPVVHKQPAPLPPAFSAIAFFPSGHNVLLCRDT